MLVNILKRDCLLSLRLCRVRKSLLGDNVIYQKAWSEIAVIRKVKNRTFIICCQSVVKCAGSFSNNHYYSTPQFHSTFAS